MYICVCDWVTLLYSRKLTEHYKPAIMEKKVIIIEKRNKKKRRGEEYMKKETTGRLHGFHGAESGAYR